MVYARAVHGGPARGPGGEGREGAGDGASWRPNLGQVASADPAGASIDSRVACRLRSSFHCRWQCAPGGSGGEHGHAEHVAFVAAEIRDRRRTGVPRDRRLGGERRRGERHGDERPLLRRLVRVLRRPLGDHDVGDDVPVRVAGRLRLRAGHPPPSRRGEAHDQPLGDVRRRLPRVVDRCRVGRLRRAEVAARGRAGLPTWTSRATSWRRWRSPRRSTSSRP